MRDSMNQLYIFAYGSLMNPKSLAKTLPGQRDIKKATLRGFQRKMSVPFSGYAYLNLIPKSDHAVSGILVPVTGPEFDLFSSREEGYGRIDITKYLDQIPEGEVYAFIAPDSECCLKVPRSYIETCTAGMSQLDKDVWIKDTLMGEILEDLDNPVYEFHA